MTRNKRGDSPPLVVAEVVDKQQCRLAVTLHGGEDAAAHQCMRHCGSILATRVNPGEVVALDELAEGLARLLLLVGEHLADTLVVRLGEFNLPAG